MRTAIWFVILFAMAVAAALFSGSNHSHISIFWQPYRIDVSLNLVIAVLIVIFLLLFIALRTLNKLLDLPKQASQWRMQQKERAMHSALLTAIGYLIAGRFSRARKAAFSAIQQEHALHPSHPNLLLGQQVRAISHIVAAASAHALQDYEGSDNALATALKETQNSAESALQELHEGAQIRSAYWALKSRKANVALAILEKLPQGIQRRTAALRIRLKASQAAGNTATALETARLLAKHHAFEPDAAQSILRELALKRINEARDSAQLQKIWKTLEANEQAIPDLAIHAAHTLIKLGDDGVQARAWLLPIWEKMLEHPNALTESQQLKLIQALTAGLNSFEPIWLTRIETAQRNNPGTVALQYLAGMACREHQLWGKAQQLLTQAAPQLKDLTLRRHAWQALAQLAEQRGDASATTYAWKMAALVA